MKANIIDAFKTKHKSFGLSNEAIDRIASALEKTVTKEDEIAGALESATTMSLIASELQKMRDKEIQTRSDLQKSFDTYKEAHPDTKPDKDKDKDKDTDSEPEWAKKLREQNEAILAAQAKREKDEKDASTLASVKSALEKAGCTNAGILNLTLKGFALKDKETEEDAVKRVTEEYNANIKATFGEGVVPPAGGGDPNPNTKAARDAHNAYLRKRGLLPQEENKTN